jgi:hypothetical protein
MKIKHREHEEKISKPQSSSFSVIFTFWLIAVSAFIYGFFSARELRWLCDDIYITLRYAQNILAGNGWVYNVGEHVEGYTHFLWLCIITFFQWLGANPEEIVKTLGLVAYCATLMVFFLITRSQWDKKTFTVPLTAIVLAVHYDFKVWSSGGLETMFFTFLMVASFYSFFFWNTGLSRRLLTTGLIATLVALTRPDGAIFFFVLALFVAAYLWQKQNSLREFYKDIGLFLVPFCLLFLPYLIWKIAYYGDFFPNTYYAKSGDLSYWSQGFYYIWSFVQAYISSIFFILFFIVIYFWWKRQEQDTVLHKIRSLFSDRSIAPSMFALVFIILYGIFFVAKVGGDFMYARFLHPLIPFSYFLLESSLNRLLKKPKRVYLFVLLAIPLLVYYERSRRDDLFIDSDGKRKDTFSCLKGIVDERWYWTRENQDGISFLDEQILLGKMISVYFRELPVKVLVTYQSFAYYSRFATCIDYFGLTNTYIAHLPLEKRSRPGHEKIAPLKYLEIQKVNFFFTHSPYDVSYYRTVHFRAGKQVMTAEMFYYDSSLVHTLKKRFPQDFFYTDFGEFLDKYLSSVSAKTKADLERDYKKFYNFYFLYANDKYRENQFRQQLGMPMIK